MAMPAGLFGGAYLVPARARAAAVEEPPSRRWGRLPRLAAGVRPSRGRSAVGRSAGRGAGDDPGVREEEGDADMPIAANLDVLLDKDYENVTLPELLNAPVAALAGVTATDAELLRQAFQIKTVGDLGRSKFFQAAQALVTLADGDAK